MKASHKRIPRLLHIIAIAATIVYSCNTKTEQSPTQKPDSTRSVVDSVQSVPGDSAIVYDTTNFPREQTYPLKIIPTGSFHADELWPNADKDSWMGIFKTANGYYLQSAKIKATRLHDAIVDEEGDKTGWEVATSSKDSCLLLISESEFISPQNPIKFVSVKPYIYPGDTVKFTSEGIRYQLFATGEKKLLPAQHESYDVWNYKLFLSTVKESETITQPLVAVPNFDDRMIKILFAGDIDGDGFIDLIIDTSRHYNGSILTLYLSKPSSEHELVQVVGMHSRAGC